MSECEHKFGPPRWAGWGVCKKCGQDEHEWKRGEDKRTIAALKAENERLRDERKRREDFGPNGDATTPGFFLKEEEKTKTLSRQLTEANERLKAENLKLNDQITSMLLLDRIQKGLTSVHELRTRAEKAEADNTALRSRLEAAEGKVEKALKIASMRSKYPATMTNYYLEHIEEIEQILRGEP